MRHIKSFKLFEANKEVNILDIMNLDSYKEGNYSGAIVDFVNNNYGREKVTDFPKEINNAINLIIMMNNYVYQVGNGGHLQYYENGYASRGSSGFGGHHSDIETHLEMMELLKGSDLYNSPMMKTIYGVLEGFADYMKRYAEYGNDDCDACDGSGWEQMNCDYCNGEGTVDHGDGEETCEECGGSGEEDIDCSQCGGEGKEEINVDLLNRLDDKLYQFHTDDIEKELNEYAGKYINAIVDTANMVQNLNK